MVEISKKVRAIVAEELGLEEDKLENTTPLEDLGADSLVIIELIMAFEDEFNIEIPDEEVGKITTVQDVVNYVDNHIKPIQ